MRVPALDLKLGPNEVLCVGCYQPKQRMDCGLGKIYKGLHFAEVKTEELVFDPLTGKTSVEEVDKKVPIGNWHKGWICSSCGSDYRTVTHKRKDGSQWYEPVVQLQRSHTQSTTLNPGESRMSSSPPPHDDGFGFVKDLIPEEELDRPSYTYFSRGGRSKLGQAPSQTIKRSLAGARSSKSEAQLNAERS